jgi:hypothetical protein
MDQNNPLQNYFNDNAQQMIQTEQSGSDYFSAVGDNIASASYATSNCEQPQPVFTFSNSEHAQSLSYAPQYTDQNISPPLSSLNNTSYTISNHEQQQPVYTFLNNDSATQPLSYAPQYIDQTPLNSLNAMIVQSEIFRFEIPGFKIIIIPASSPLANLDMQNQQDYTYLNPTTSLVGQPQLNQEQSYVSSVNGTSSGGSSTHYQQQNFNESSNNFSNLHD